MPFVSRVVAVLVLALPLNVAVAAPLDPELIVWRLDNPFRYFLDPQATERHIAAFRGLADSDKGQPVVAVERSLAASSGGRGWAEPVFAKVADEACWYVHDLDPKSRQSACGTYVLPESHLVRVHAPQLTGMCVWSAGMHTFAPQDCARDREIEIPYPLGVEVQVSIDGVVKARRDIIVEDLLVLGLGDSFGSGEGNPDRAVTFSDAGELNYPDTALQGYPLRAGARTDVPPVWRQTTFRNRAAGWLHRGCHRSLYSQQLRTALHLAISDPDLHRSVTYLGLACSGSTILSLFETYQGINDPPAAGDPAHSTRKLQLSQLSIAAHALCRPGTAVKDESLDYNAFDGETELLKLGKQPIQLHRCRPEERLRGIDFVLLSIGGNDVGFSQLVANASLLKGYIGIPRLFAEDLTVDPAKAERYMKRLPGRYHALAHALKTVLGLDDPTRVLLTAYPIMGSAAVETPCTSGNAGMDVAPAWYLNSKVIDRTEAFVAETFTPAMAEAAKRHGWTFVDGHRDQVQTAHGLCAKEEADADRALANDVFPRHVPSEGRSAVWKPYRPHTFKPYAVTQRYFRTPNDAFMTVNFHGIEAAIRSYSLPLQLTGWSAYSGAFHPNALGHAAIADAVTTSLDKLMAARPRPPGP